MTTMADAIPIESKAEWLELRRHNINASEIPALFGESSYLTPFELWHIKRGELPEPDLSGSDFAFWGNVLESAIARGVELKTGWRVEKAKAYFSDPTVRIGGTPDYFIHHPDRGVGILEIKNVERFMWKRWGEAMPLHFELQPQTYCGLTGYQWCMIAALIGGNNLQLGEYEARPKVYDIVRNKVSEFWKSIESNTPPNPDFGTDYDAISELYRSVTVGKVVDLSASNRLPELINEYRLAAAEKREGEKSAKAAKAEIHMLLGDAEMALCGDYTIKAHEVSGTADRDITADNIGQTIRGREGYRGLWISQRRDEAGK